MTDFNLDDFLLDADKWAVPDPDYLGDVLDGAVGGDPCATTRTQCAQNLLNLSAHTPVAMVYVNQDDPDRIQVCHSLNRYPAVLGNPCNFDNLVVALQGRSCDDSIPVAFPITAFQRIDARCLRLANIVGPAGFGAAVPVIHTGPHGVGTADTDDLNVRKVMVLPPPAAGATVRQAPEGTYTYQGFYNTILNVGLTHADAGVQALWAPVRSWFRAACTVTGGAGNPISVGITPVPVNTPNLTFRLNAFAVGVKRQLKNRNGIGGPGLTNNVFQAGVADLQNTMDTNANNRLQFERDRAERSFTERHGTQLAQRMYRLCSVAADANLPECHRLLAKSTSKSRDYAILSNLFQERCVASVVPLTPANSPLATTTLVDDAFRSFTPAGSGLLFAKGLSPFAIVCEGHQESHELQRLIKQAEVAEAGTTMSLADAERITSTDPKFPTTPYFAGEKMYGWSIVVDVFHGHRTDIANAVRGFVVRIVPHLHRIHDQMGDTPAVGMDLVCRVMYEAQQEYFHYCKELAAGAAPACPTFSSIEHAVITYRVSSLSPLPSLWYNKLDAPTNASRPAPSQGQGSSARNQAGVTPAFNAHAERRLLKRYAESGHSTISAMLQGHDVTVPKHNGNPVCLTWALKGECSTGCRRKNQHVRYARSTNQAIHALMDACGVANAQE